MPPLHSPQTIARAQAMQRALPTATYRAHPTGQGRDGSVGVRSVSGQSIMAQFRARKALEAAAKPPISGLDGISLFQGVTAVNLVASSALAYHGYKRNNSIVWACVWGLLVPPIIGVPVALAQGFGKKRGK